MASASGLRDAESIIFNRGCSVASWTFTGRVFHPAQLKILQKQIKGIPLNLRNSYVLKTPVTSIHYTDIINFLRFKLM